MNDIFQPEIYKLEIMSQRMEKRDPIGKVTGPCIILAGAGTGKTYTIVEKLKYLILKGIYAPERIACLTFSNEAVNSLRERILKILPEGIPPEKEPAIRTFHSFCSDLIKKHGSKIGINENFRILLPEDAKIMMHKNFKVNPSLCHEYVSTISIAKDLGIDIGTFETYLIKRKMTGNNQELEELLKELQFKLQVLHTGKSEGRGDKEEKAMLKERIENLSKELKMRKFLQAWKNYEKLKDKKGMLDYSDLHQKALILLERFPEIAEEFDYIIVDEFQDTNKLQVDLLEKLAPKKNITVVGDLNQSIYRFRGAYKDNLLVFKKAFNIQDKDIFALDKSHRSSNTILRIAHKLIEHNYKNKEETFPVYNAYNEEGNKVEAYQLKNSQEETRKIIELIREEQTKGTPLEKICVMFRTHQQARAIKAALEMEKIPYVSVTRNSLLKTPLIKKARDYLAILNLLKNKSKGGEQAWWSLLFNSGFSREDAIILGEYIRKVSKENKLPLSEKLINDSEIKLSEAGNVRLGLIVSKIRELMAYTESSIGELIMQIYVRAGLYPQPDDILEKEKVLVLEKFHSLAKEFAEAESPALGDFLYHLGIIESLGIEIEAPSLAKEGVRIMTNHATKGLEYDTVIVSSLAQKKFPIERFSGSLIPPQLMPELREIVDNLSPEESEELAKRYEIENQLLEERRLCYVAFTRTRKRLILTHALEYGNKKHLSSQFLNEIEYKTNPDIVFKEDNNEVYKERLDELKTAFELEKKPETFDKIEDKIVLSQSALQTFTECEKRYEYKYVYHMPDEYPNQEQWAALKLGSFVHVVFEKGVRSGFRTEREFIELAKMLQVDEEWSFINVEDAIPLIRIFFQRNKDKYSSKSLTEEKLYINLDGIKFMGIADRIDFSDDGVEIVDYKTGASDILPKYRNWQLGLYALAAAEKFGLVRQVTLEMLRKDKALEFELDEKGNAREIHSSRMFFNLFDVEQELIAVARAIISGYKQGFKPCSVDKNCDFCTEMGFR